MIPVTAVEQPVGKILDISGRVNHAYQATDAKRPVLSARVNRLTATATLSTQSFTSLATTYTLSFSGTGSVTLSGTASGTYAAGTHSVVATAGTLTVTVSGTVLNADMREPNIGVGLPPYQRVTSATEYDAAVFPRYLQFDGVDDFLATNSINFTATDKIAVFAGVRKQSDAGRGIVVEPASSVFQINAPIGASATYAFVSSGTLSSTATSPASYPAPITSILTGIGDISGDIARLMVNGAQVAERLTDQGTGNYGNQIVYIGSRGGASLLFKGGLHQLILAGSQPSAQTISMVNGYVNGRTRAY